jgi:hypothetical protein
MDSEIAEEPNGIVNEIRNPRLRGKLKRISYQTSPLDSERYRDLHS